MMICVLCEILVLVSVCRVLFKGRFVGLVVRFSIRVVSVVSVRMVIRVV